MTGGPKMPHDPACRFCDGTGRITALIAIDDTEIRFENYELMCPAAAQRNADAMTAAHRRQVDATNEALARVSRLNRRMQATESMLARAMREGLHAVEMWRERYDDVADLWSRAQPGWQAARIAELEQRVRDMTDAEMGNARMACDAAARIDGLEHALMIARAALESVREAIVGTILSGTSAATDQRRCMIESIISRGLQSSVHVSKHGIVGELTHVPDAGDRDGSR